MSKELLIKLINEAMEECEDLELLNFIRTLLITDTPIGAITVN